MNESTTPYDDWPGVSACIGHPDIMFDGFRTAAAKQLCATCPNSQGDNPCLQYALDHKLDYGVWGGVTETERRRIPGRGSLVPAPTVAPPPVRPLAIEPDGDLWSDATQPEIFREISRWRHRRRELLDTEDPPVLVLRPHGTTAAIKRHKRHHESLCDLCKTEHARQERERLNKKETTS